MVFTNSVFTIKSNNTPCVYTIMLYTCYQNRQATIVMIIVPMKCFCDNDVSMVELAWTQALQQMKSVIKHDACKSHISIQSGNIILLCIYIYKSYMRETETKIKYCRQSVYINICVVTILLLYRLICCER